MLQDLLPRVTVEQDHIDLHHINKKREDDEIDIYCEHKANE